MEFRRRGRGPGSFRRAACKPAIRLPCPVIPQRDFDGAGRCAPGLECAHAANLQHDSRDVRGALTDEILLIEQDHRLEIRIGGLRLSVTGDSLIVTIRMVGFRPMMAHLRSVIFIGTLPVRLSGGVSGLGGV